MPERHDAIEDEPAPLTRTRSLSNSSNDSDSSEASVTSTTAIVKKTPASYGSSDHEDEDHGATSRLSDVSDISPADRPIEITEKRRNWKRILLWVLPPVFTVIALAVSLGLYFGLRNRVIHPLSILILHNQLTPQNRTRAQISSLVLSSTSATRVTRASLSQTASISSAAFAMPRLPSAICAGAPPLRRKTRPRSKMLKM
jgi:hypothetical protein